MLAVDRVHRWRLLFSPRSCLSLRGVDVPETLFGFPRTIRLCFSTGTVSSLSESGGTGEASREETTYVFFVVFVFFFFFFLVVLRHGSFQSHILFVDILYYCVVKRFGCYEKHRKKKRRERKSDDTIFVHHRRRRSKKASFLCLFDTSIKEEEEDERCARTGTSKTLP